MPVTYDFSGMATAYNVRCQDGRVIKPGAFDRQAGQTVPIVWRHGHSDINNIVGHGTLSVSEAPPGMKIHGNFNDTTEGNRAKRLVANGDISNLSIYANELLEHSESGLEPGLRSVNKGTIREVSLVIAGKNPGAHIQEVVRHSEEPFDDGTVVLDGIIIHNQFNIDPAEVVEKPGDPKDSEEPEDVTHGEEDSLNDIVGTLNDAQRDLFNVMLHSAASGESPEGATGEGPTFKETFESLNDEQRNVLYYMVGEVQAEQSISQGDDIMPQHKNIFENKEEDKGKGITREKVNSVLKHALDRKSGFLSEAFEANDIPVVSDESLSHSITNLDYMFPEAREAKSGGPDFIKRDTEWVEGVFAAVSTRPFSKVKTTHADITADEARALGYVKGDLKVEEVLVLLKRETDAQTIYKKQKLDRDDILDITDWNVVVWMKSEMKMMLREEVARALLFSDGRLVSDDYKVKEDKIRPVYNDSSVYTTQYRFHDAGNEQALSEFDAAETTELIDYIAASRISYKGAGSPVFYTGPGVVSKMLLLRDNDNHRLHRTEADLAAALRVSKIVEVPVVDNMSYTEQIGDNNFTIQEIGVIVNLKDYVIGTNNGGQTNFFDDFDIDYNQYKYLYETRLSGALVTPESAINIELVTADLGAA